MNKYEILNVIGEGAYGVVLKCRNRETNQIFAIKKFKETDEDEVVRKNIQREVKMLKALRHKNVVDLVEAFKRKGRIFLVFEYVEKNLLEVLEENANGLDPEFIRRVIYQILKALSHCHKHDIIHRDIKPENLLMNSDGTLKLCDFGFARSMPPKVNEVITDYVATRWYRSPELLLSDPQYSFPVDIWAVACIMGELIDGNPLFPGKDEIDQLYLIQKLLGPFTPDQHELFIKNGRYVGLKFPEIPKAETIERRYLGKLSKKALTFMKAMLKMDPTERLTVTEAMAHPYFDGIRELYPDEAHVGSSSIPQSADPMHPNRTMGLNNNIRSIAEDKGNVDQEEKEICDKKVTPNIFEKEDDNKVIYDGKQSLTIHHEGDEKNGIYAKLSKENLNSSSSTKVPPITCMPTKRNTTIFAPTKQQMNSKNFYSTNKLTPQYAEGHKVMQNTLYNYNIDDGSQSGENTTTAAGNKRNSNHFETSSSKAGRPLFDTMSLGQKPPKNAPGSIKKSQQSSGAPMMMMMSGGQALPTLGNQKKFTPGNDFKANSPSLLHNSKISFTGTQNYGKGHYQSPAGPHGMNMKSGGNDMMFSSKYQNLNVIYNNNTYNYNSPHYHQQQQQQQQQAPIVYHQSSVLPPKKSHAAPAYSKKKDLY